MALRRPGEICRREWGDQPSPAAMLGCSLIALEKISTHCLPRGLHLAQGTACIHLYGPFWDGVGSTFSDEMMPQFMAELVRGGRFQYGKMQNVIVLGQKANVRK